MTDHELIRQFQMLNDKFQVIDEKLGKMATKEELRQMEASTKEELRKMEARLATKEELRKMEARLATKEELRQMEARLATKEELRKMEARLATNEELRQMETRISVKIENEVTEKIEALFDGYKLTHEKQWELERRMEKLERQLQELRDRIA